MTETRHPLAPVADCLARFASLREQFGATLAEVRILREDCADPVARGRACRELGRVLDEAGALAVEGSRIFLAAWAADGR